MPYGVYISVLLCLGLVQAQSAFDWGNLASSSNLTWTPCYNSFQCARLKLPLQYSNASAGEVQIALLMSPSKYSSDDPNYLGPLVFNFGGPGSSGTQYILKGASYFRVVVGPQYDLIGFDPRGFGFSTPLISIFDSPVEAASFYSTYPVAVNGSDSSLGREYAQATILNRLATDRASEFMQSVSTVAVANDMLRITQALGQDKLNYWGVSYGTTIGAVFAALYPDKVGRFILDGVLNSHDWFQGTIVSSVLDTDNALTAYYAACVEAGPSLCAIYNSSADAIRGRVDNLIARAQVAPIPVYVDTNASAISFGVVDATTIMQQLFTMLDYPFSTGPAFAEAIVQLEQGNGSAIFQGSDAGMFAALDTCEFNSSQPFQSTYLETITPILCGDNLNTGTLTLDQSRAAYEDMLAVSQFAPVWYAQTEGPCAQWTLRGADKFNGSFVQNTSTPILFISNTNDPLTPIENARNMSSGFDGSVILQQNSTGHTSFSGFSTCTARAIGAYLVNETLPAAGTICQTDTLLFQDPTNSSAIGGITFPTNGRRDMSNYDLNLSFEDAVKAIGRGESLGRNGWLGIPPRSQWWV